MKIKDKEKAKLTKGQIVQRIFLYCGAAIVAIGACIIGVKAILAEVNLKEDKIRYQQDTTEWEKEYQEQLEYYLYEVDDSYYASYINDFYYEYEIVEENAQKRVDVVVTNGTSQKSLIRNMDVIAANFFGETIYYQEDINCELSAGASCSISQELPTDLEFEEIKITLHSITKYYYNDENYYVGEEKINSYSGLLKELKVKLSSKLAEQSVGSKPEDNSEERYRKNKSSIAAGTGLFFGVGGLTFFIGLMILCERLNNTSYTSSSGSDVRIIHTIHMPSDKSVTCLHCNSTYDEHLDKCPNCGSSQIKEDNQYNSDDDTEVS